MKAEITIKFGRKALDEMCVERGSYSPEVIVEFVADEDAAVAPVPAKVDLDA